ncbi:hypothetical protein C8J57DRAFT_1294087, partial [Mycena rebaudengoi]
RFPRRRPADDPPLVKGDRVDGRPTPTYVLGWLCPDRKFFENLGGGTLGKVHHSNFSDVISANWVANSPAEFGHSHAPLAYPVALADGNFCLIGMFNRPDADHFTRVRNLAEVPLIDSARVAMGVDKDRSLEDTLQWYRWPLHWLYVEQRERERAEDELSELEKNTSTKPSQVTVH